MTNPNDPAFPVPVDAQHKGLTKREMFAAMAMQGLLANPTASSIPYEVITQTSVRLADYLIEALNKPTETT